MYAHPEGRKKMEMLRKKHCLIRKEIRMFACAGC